MDIILSLPISQWPVVLTQIVLFGLFVVSLWTSTGISRGNARGPFDAFTSAFFSDMYGWAMIVYLLAGWGSSYIPVLDLYSHAGGHFWLVFIGRETNAHFNIIHIVSSLFIGGGAVLTIAAWRVLYRVARQGRLATEELYGSMRHPQYSGLTLIAFGLLVQWPTFLTVVMFFLLAGAYVRRAYHEENDLHETFGSEYQKYRTHTPAFLPQLFGRVRG